MAANFPLPDWTASFAEAGSGLVKSWGLFLEVEEKFSKHFYLVLVSRYFLELERSDVCVYIILYKN